MGEDFEDLEDLEGSLEFLELGTECCCHELEQYGCEELDTYCYLCGGDYEL